MAATLSVLSPLVAYVTSKWMMLVAFLGAFVVVSCVLKLIRGIRAVDSLPSLYVPFAPLTVPAIGLPLAWWNYNHTFVWEWRKSRNVYDRFGRDTVTFVPFIHGNPSIFTRSLEVAKQILLGGLDAFDKSPDSPSPFLFWGPNIIDAYGDQWRKHRKIASPAFDNHMFATVWDTSRKLFTEMMVFQGWDQKDAIEVADINSITLKFSLTVFTSSGFGVPWTWYKPPSQNDALDVQECIEIITKTPILTLLPSWVWRLPFAWIQRARRAHDTMRTFMRSQVTIIRESIRSKVDDGDTKLSNDLFSLLTRASEDVGGKLGLSDDELIGDVFAFLFAGHDTTAHALSATFAFLAVNPDVQEELASQVREVAEGRSDGALHYEDYGKLNKVLAAFYETIRMIPPGPIILREVKRDVVLNISDTDEPRLLAVKKGTQVMVDLVGMQYAPKRYSEPEVYRPSRWYAQQQDPDSDVKEGSRDPVSFGFGPRSCIGRKFATVEAVCFLAHLLRDWRIEPSLVQHSNGGVESVEEWWKRIFRADTVMTLAIKSFGIRFVRRN